MGLDPPVGEMFCTFPLSFSHQADKTLSLHLSRCAKPEERLKFKQKAWAQKVLSTFWARVSSGTWGKSPWPPTSCGLTHSMRCVNTRTPLHSTQCVWLNSNTLTLKHLTKAEVSRSTSHPQPPHQQHNYNKNSRLLHATHRAIPATLGLCLRHLHLPLIFRNKFLNAHTELQEKAPNNSFVTLFLNTAWNR